MRRCELTKPVSQDATHGGTTMNLTRIAALAAAAVTLAAAPLAVAQDKVSLRLNWYLGGLHVPFYYGKDKGYYAAEGIDLTINEGRGSANTVQVVAAGSDTFGLADSSSVVAHGVEGRRHQERDVAAQHHRLLGRVAGRSAHQDAEGPRRQEGRGHARRSARHSCCRPCARRTTSIARRSAWCRSIPPPRS